MTPRTQKTTLSRSDSKRLRDAFFASSSPNPKKKNNNKKAKIKPIYKKNRLEKYKALLSYSGKKIAATLAVFAVIISLIVVLANRDPKEKSSLLIEDSLASIKLINSENTPNLKSGMIEIKNIEDNNPGFVINFDKTVDLTDSKILLVLKNPHNSFMLKAILRDINHFSNSKNPISLVLHKKDLKKKYVKIPIDLATITHSYLNTSIIKQIRFYFAQSTTQKEPFFVKNVIVEKGGEK